MMKTLVVEAPGGFYPDGSYLDLSRTGVPVVDTIIDIAVTAVVVIGLTLVAYAKWVHPQVKAIRSAAEGAARDAAVAREHTENSHAGASNPNLRDDLDAKHHQTHTELANLARMIARLEETGHATTKTLERQDAELARINNTLLADRQAQRKTAEELAEHIRDKSQMEPRLAKVEQQLAQHRQATET